MIPSIRTATRDDLAAILDLYADDALSLHRPMRDATAYHDAFAAIEADPRTALYVATVRDEAAAGGAQHDGTCGRVVATFQLTILERLTARVMQLESVHVHSSVRARGIGTTMLHWALAEARTRGCTRVELTSQKRRKDAHRFYERLGFVASHEGMKLELG